MTVLEPYLVAETEAGLSPEAIAKLLRKLAKQVVKKPSQAFEAKASTTSPTKQARQQVVATLTSDVAGYVGTPEKPGKGASKALTKTIKRLAKQVVKQQRNQAPAKAKRAAATPKPDAVPAAQPAPSPTRRPPAKRAAAKAVRSAPAGSPDAAAQDTSPSA